MFSHLVSITEEEDAKDWTPIIVGGVVGGVLLIILVIVIIILVTKKDQGKIASSPTPSRIGKYSVCVCVCVCVCV